MTYRVAPWWVGGVGRQALRALVSSSDFDVVGVFTHSASRLGRDAGELGGLDVDTGVRAGSDAGAILDMRPDCVVFTSVGETRPQQAVEELARTGTASPRRRGSTGPGVIDPRPPSRPGTGGPGPIQNLAMR